MYNRFEVGDFMVEDNNCQFYIIIGEKDFTPLNKKDVYINATGVNDINLISMAISREYKKKMSMETPAVVSNKIIFLVPSYEYDSVCKKIVNELGIMYYEIKNISEYIVKNRNEEEFEAVRQVESDLVDNKDITASGSKNIEIQNDTGRKNVTISDNNAYVNSGLLSIDEEKKILLQEWKNDPYMSARLSSLSPEEIDRMLVESVTKNLTAYRMESSREQNANDKVGEIAKDKAKEEDGLVNTELGIVRNNVSNSNQYSTVEQSGNNIYVVNPNVTSTTINTSGVSGNLSSNYSNWDANIVVNDEQEREVLGEFYFDDDYNVYDNNGEVIGKNGQDGVWMSYDSNTGVSKLVVNGKVMGYIDHIKNMNIKKTNKHVLTKKKPEYKSAAFVSLPVIIFVLSAMLLIGSVILLFVLK